MKPLSLWRAALLGGVSLCSLIGLAPQARAQSGPFVYVPDFGSNTLSVIDIPTNTAAGSITVGSNPYTVAVRGDQSLVYVTNYGSNTVSVINTAANTVTATVNVGATPYVVAVSPDGTRAYVSNGNSNSVSVINTATNTVIATVPVGNTPIGVAFSPDGTRAYVTNLFGNSVSVINTATNTVTATFTVGSSPFGVAFSPDGTRAYVSNGNSNSVSVIDTATNTVTATVTVGTVPTGVAFSPDGGRAYVTNLNSDTVSVINVATGTVIATLNAGFNPRLPGICSNGNALLASGLTFQANTSSALACTGVSGPIFTGGTMRFAGANITSALPITLMSQGGTFDTAGNQATLSGAISGPGGLTKIGLGTLTLSGAGTYSGPTAVNAGTLQAGAINAFSPNSAYAVAIGAVLDLNSFNQSIGSLAGSGNVTLGSATLTTGNDGTSTVFAGGISGTGGLTKIGAGTLTLSGASSYTGPTFVNAGTLQKGAGNAFSPFSAYAVAAGAALDLNGFSQLVSGLTGAGSVINSGAVVPTLTIASGGVFAPGNGTPGSSMSIAGNLAFQSGAIYLVQVSPAAASFATVTGATTLTGATVNAVFAGGSYVSKQYTIVTANGSISGAFANVIDTNLPGNFHTTLSYDANHAYLNLILNFAIPDGLNSNQQAVGNALTSFFNTHGTIPLLYSALTAPGLTQASGESATGSQQTTFAAMNQFIGLLTDPFMGRGNPISGSVGATPYAEQSASSYARASKPTDAFAMFGKAPPASFVPRWSVWAAGYGGSQSTSGNAMGSNDTTSRIAGTAVGADYLFSPTTLAGFALAGGGTSFGVNNLGSGTSDLFQAGAYVRHTNGPAYITAAAAYGWQDITTNRTVTIAGIDQLRAEFNANAYSGRVEGGYRFAAPWTGGIGITPYAAGQFTTFDLPAYAEGVVLGTPNFALTYAARSVTDSRSELGVRTDKSFAVTNGVLTLRGRFAWAHDFDPNRAVAATFQALPGASFVVGGAAQAYDSALTTASAEMKWINGWSAAATFEGEFSNVTRSYAGKGVVRYAW